MPNLYSAPQAENYNTSLTNALTSSATSMTLDSVTNLQVPTILVIDRIDANSNLNSTAKWEYVLATAIAGNDVTITRGRGGSTAQSHSAGAIVEAVVSAEQWEGLRTWATALADDNGLLKAIVSPVSIAILDSNRLAVVSVASIARAEIGTFVANTWDGWLAANETWTYASATTFTISGDKTSKYQKGDKTKLTQTTVKYFYIVGVSYSAPNTTVTVTGGDDYSLANAAITDNYYSKVASPQGFPQYFSWTPTWTGNGTMTFTSISYNLRSFAIIGKVCFVGLRATGTIANGDTTLSATLPVNNYNGYYLGGGLRLSPAGLGVEVGLLGDTGELTKINITRPGSAAFTNGSTGVFLNFFYFI